MDAHEGAQRAGLERIILLRDIYAGRWGSSPLDHEDDDVSASRVGLGPVLL